NIPINKGYLIKLSAKLIQTTTILETIFKDFHTCNSLNKSPEKITNALRKNHFCKTRRTFIKSNNLNNDLSIKVVTSLQQNELKH
ncbi:Uncharacterized protein FWK35_00035094, partial [Aphis craccivora]